MNRKKYVPETQEQIRQSRQKWADYHRLRRLPRKECVRCGKDLPNNAKHFKLGVRGRLTGTCLECAAVSQTPAASIRARCPICDEVKTLVRDLHAPPAPHVVRLCRKCLLTVNTMTTTTERFRNMRAYVEWCARAKGWLPAQASMPLEVPVTEDDDELIIDPFGEPEQTDSFPEVEANPRVASHDTYDYTGE